MEVVMEEFMEILDGAEEIALYRYGKEYDFVAGDGEYGVILGGFKNMIAGARNMPAFGVSLDGETREAMKRGVWVEFRYDTARSYNEMPFEKLLVEVNGGRSGFNIVRYNSDGGYAGRCYYLDLSGTTTEFYGLLKTI